MKLQYHLVICENQGADWESCNMSEVDKLVPIGGDIIDTFSKDGMNKAVRYMGDGEWFTTSEDGSESDVGNDTYQTCEATDGTCITRGFIGRILFNIGENCTTGNCPGTCPNPNCECGSREDMIHCGDPMGWLKFKEDFSDGQDDEGSQEE